MSVLTYMRCHLCGNLLAESDKGFQEHLKRFHGVNGVTGVAERKNRTTPEIVAEIERRFASHIIDGSKHYDECRCTRCFDKRLDALWNQSKDLAKNDYGQQN